MNYVEKNYPPPTGGGWGGAPGPKFDTYEAFKKHMDGQVGFMRKMMGGVSRDITRRPILMEDIQVKGYDGDIKVRVYTPKGEGAGRKFMLYIHGGGWMGGSLWAVEEYCKAIADRADAVVASVEYHLAPEHPFPWGLMDSYAALEWAWDHADTLGIDRERFSISGDSAGGNYSAAIALMARDGGKIKLENEILLYPAVVLAGEGFVGPGGPSTDPINDAGRVMYDWYVQDGTPSSDPRISPLLAEDLTGLPRTMIVACELDGLRFQNKEYADKLDASGVEVTYLFFKGTPHAFIDNTGVDAQAEDLINEVVTFLG